MLMIGWEMYGFVRLHGSMCVCICVCVCHINEDMIKLLKCCKGKTRENVSSALAHLVCGTLCITMFIRTLRSTSTTIQECVCVCVCSLKLEAMTTGVQPLWSRFKDREWVQRLEVKLPSRECLTEVKWTQHCVIHTLYRSLPAAAASKKKLFSEVFFGCAHTRVVWSAIGTSPVLNKKKRGGKKNLATVASSFFFLSF